MSGDCFTCGLDVRRNSQVVILLLTVGFGGGVFHSDDNNGFFREVFCSEAAFLNIACSWLLSANLRFKYFLNLF